MSTGAPGCRSGRRGRCHGDRGARGAGRPADARAGARHLAGEDRRDHAAVAAGSARDGTRPAGPRACEARGVGTAHGGVQGGARLRAAPAGAGLRRPAPDDDVSARLPAMDQLLAIDLSMPWMTGFAGFGNYAKMGGDGRFWSSLGLTAIYTGMTVALQVVVGLGSPSSSCRSRAGRRSLRVAAILPIVLAPVVVGLFWRTLVLTPDFGIVDFATARSASAGTTGSATRISRSPPSSRSIPGSGRPSPSS